jgi:type VI protein secretion system component VasK
VGLRGLQKALDELARASPADLQALIPPARQALAQAKSAHHALADKFDDAGNQGLNRDLADLLEQPIRYAEVVIPALIDPIKDKATRVNTALAVMCRQVTPVLGKYPFNQTGDQNDATPDDIQRIFAPSTGLVWQFQQKLLAETVPPEPKLRVHPGLTAFLDKAQQTTDAFFSGEKKQLGFTYVLRPTPGSGIHIKLDGKEMNSSITGLQIMFQWPAPGGNLGGAQAFEVIAGQEFPFGQYDGIWGAFRLFQYSDSRAPGVKQVQWSEIRGKGTATPQKLQTPAKLEFVQFPGNVDLFNPKFFEGLRCPSQALIAE